MNIQNKLCIGFLMTISFLVTGTQYVKAQQSHNKDPEYIKTKAELKSNEQFKNLPVPDFDTTALQNDPHTQKVKELMKQMGVMDVAVLSSRMLIDKQAKEPSLFLQDFYARMVQEMKSGRIYRYMEDAIAKIYRESFTIEELDQLMAFYETPIGKKTISLLPAITLAGGREGEKIGKYMGMVIIHEMINE